MNDKQIETRRKEILARPVALNGGDYCGCAKYITTEEQRELDELAYRKMIICCVCYGEEYDIYSERTQSWGDTGFKYGVSKLGFDKALEVFRDQVNYMREHAKIHHGVYTDYEGCTYNSIEWS